MPLTNVATLIARLFYQTGRIALWRTPETGRAGPNWAEYRNFCPTGGTSAPARKTFAHRSWRCFSFSFKRQLIGRLHVFNSKFEIHKYWKCVYSKVGIKNQWTHILNSIFGINNRGHMCSITTLELRQSWNILFKSKFGITKLENPPTPLGVNWRVVCVLLF